jgi:thiol-disulfide isomerase/thioredoxin
MPAKTYLVLAAVLLAAVACGNTSSTSGSAAPSTTTAAAAASTPPVLTPTLAALPNGYNPRRDAKADIAAALAKSKADKRPVLLDFGANWCPDCVALEHTFGTDTVRPVINGFHVVAVDVGRFDRHLDLATKYHLDLRTSGIPAFVVLSGTGKVRTTTNDGSFANARTMTPDKVAAFLERWQ